MKTKDILLTAGMFLLSAAFTFVVLWFFCGIEASERFP